MPFPGEQLSGFRNDPLSAVVNLHHVDGCPYCNRNALVDVLCQQRRERCASDVFCSFPIGQNFIQCIGDNWRIAAETAGRTGIAYKFCAGIRAVLCAVFPVKAALVQVFVNKIGNAGAVACLPQQHDCTGAFTASGKTALAEIGDGQDALDDNAVCVRGNAVDGGILLQDAGVLCQQILLAVDLGDPTHQYAVLAEIVGVLSNGSPAGRHRAVVQEVIAGAAGIGLPSGHC